MRKFTIFVLMVLNIMSCNNDDRIIEIKKKIDNKSWLTRFELLDCPRYDQITNTTWNLDGFILFHTDGLRQMALSGSALRLNEEYCDFGLFGGNIPGGMGDDFENVGYGERLELNEWLIAKYTITEFYPDNWIMYRVSDGYWERWDLANSDPGELKPFILLNSLE
jgi:hypothetical protein